MGPGVGPPIWVQGWVQGWVKGKGPPRLGSTWGRSRGGVQGPRIGSIHPGEGPWAGSSKAGPGVGPGEGPGAGSSKVGPGVGLGQGSRDVGPLWSVCRVGSRGSMSNLDLVAFSSGFGNQVRISTGLIQLQPVSFDVSQRSQCSDVVSVTVGSDDDDEKATTTPAPPGDAHSWIR